MDEKLRVSGLTVAPGCSMSCPFCSIKSKPGGLPMGEELLTALLRSDQLEFPSAIRISELGYLSDRVIHLGSGEVLNYFHEGKKFFNILKILLVDFGYCVSFTTAGLTPPNKELGTQVLRSLLLLPPDALERLWVSISFAPIHIERWTDYIFMIQETIRLLSLVSPDHLTLIPIFGKGKKDETEALVRKHFPKLSIAQIASRFISPLGAALENFHEFEQIRPDICQLTEALYYLRKGEPVSDRLKFGIEPDGNIVLGYCCVGAASAKLGNVYENDATQVRALAKIMLEELVERRKAKPEGMRECEWHRRWDRKFTAPRSANPIVPRRVLC